eukprot:COSAG03_NODE_374_length_8424_cov_44.358626_1_plen_31_part_10
MRIRSYIRQFRMYRIRAVSSVGRFRCCALML